MKSLKDVVSFYILRNIHFAKFQSSVSYGQISRGGESTSSKVLKIQYSICCLMSTQWKEGALV
jgi:hypothetical protein